MTQPAPDRSVERIIREHALLFDTRWQAVIGTTREGVIAYWNERAASVYGWRAAEVLGRDILQVTPALPVRGEAEEIMARLRAGRSWSGEFRVRRRDGFEFPARVWNHPVRDAAGELIGIVGVSSPAGERAP